MLESIIVTLLINAAEFSSNEKDDFPIKLLSSIFKNPFPDNSILRLTISSPEIFRLLLDFTCPESTHLSWCVFPTIFTGKFMKVSQLPIILDIKNKFSALDSMACCKLLNFLPNES
eukprot:NODE_48_length_31852_cov_1.054168.p23 type:complete len:116 gc:universal NODE_48_length_31852_cov_1.054168:2838-2491(-)